nr:outer membrane lipoprotein carrier protein LolA [Caldimonas sp.]
MRRAERLGAIAATLVALALASAVALAPLGDAFAASFDLEALTALLAKVRSGEATFVETRRIEMLDRTLTSSGRLMFKAPDVFVRETLKPRHEKLAVDGNTLTMSIGERSRTLQLDASPEAAVIVEAIRGTLTGNRAALERLFETRVGGDAAAWTLELVPRDLRLRGQVASVRVAGRESTVREVRVLLADGDHSLMTIEPVAPRRAAS